MIINGDREHLAFVLRKLHDLYNNQDENMEDSLEKEEVKRPATNNKNKNGDR